MKICYHFLRVVTFTSNIAKLKSERQIQFFLNNETENMESHSYASVNLLP